MHKYDSKDFIRDYGNLIRTMEPDDIYALLSEEILKTPREEAASLLMSTLCCTVAFINTVDVADEAREKKAEALEMIAGMAMRHGKQGFHVFCLAQAFQMSVALADMPADKKEAILDLAGPAGKGAGFEYDTEGNVRASKT